MKKLIYLLVILLIAFSGAVAKGQGKGKNKTTVTSTSNGSTTTVTSTTISAVDTNRWDANVQIMTSGSQIVLAWTKPPVGIATSYSLNSKFTSCQQAIDANVAYLPVGSSCYSQIAQVSGWNQLTGTFSECTPYMVLWMNYSSYLPKGTEITFTIAARFQSLLPSGASIQCSKDFIYVVQ